MSNFPDRLKQLRNDRKVTQTQLAEAIGITDRACRRYESGENEPTLSVLQNMADFFKVSVDYLIGRENFWRNSEGNITVKVPIDILNLDVGELKKKHRKKNNKDVRK